MKQVSLLPSSPLWYLQTQNMISTKSRPTTRSKYLSPRLTEAVEPCTMSTYVSAQELQQRWLASVPATSTDIGNYGLRDAHGTMTRASSEVVQKRFPI